MIACSRMRDGAKIAFASERDGQAELYVVNADGSGVTRLTFNVGFAGQPAWFPDGGGTTTLEVQVTLSRPIGQPVTVRWTTVGFTFRELSPSVWMITPQLTEQYGQVERVSVVRAILSVRTWATAGVKSKPSTDRVTPPSVEAFRNCRRL